MYGWFNKRLRQMFWGISLVSAVCTYFVFSEDGGASAGIMAAAIYVVGVYLVLGIGLGESIKIKNGNIVIRNGLIFSKQPLADLKMVGIEYHEWSRFKYDRKRIAFVFQNTDRISLNVQYGGINKKRLKDVLDQIKEIRGAEVEMELIYKPLSFDA